MSVTIQRRSSDHQEILNVLLLVHVLLLHLSTDLLSGQVTVKMEVVEALFFPTCRNRQGQGGALSLTQLKLGLVPSLSPGRLWRP